MPKPRRIMTDLEKFTEVFLSTGVQFNARKSTVMFTEECIHPEVGCIAFRFDPAGEFQGVMDYQKDECRKRERIPAPESA